MSDTTDPGSFEDVLGLITGEPKKADHEDVVDAADDEAPADEQTHDEEVAENDTAETDDSAVEAADDAEDQSDALSEEAHDDVSGEEASEEQIFTVKVDGETRTVTLDELLRGYSGQEYVQRGMKDAAALKKEAENAYSVLQDELKAVRDLRLRIENGDGLSKPAAPDREMFKNDPLGYMEARLEYEAALERYDADQDRLNKLGEVDQRRNMKAQQQYLAQQAQILEKRIPDFADPEKAPALREKLVKAGENYYGFSGDELRGVSDARMVMLLHDATRYRAQLAAGAQAKSQTAKPKPVIKPGSAKTEMTSQAKKRQNAKARMQRKGDMESVINFLMS